MGLEIHDLNDLIENFSDVESGKVDFKFFVFYSTHVQSIFNHILKMVGWIQDNLSEKLSLLIVLQVLFELLRDWDDRIEWSP